MLEFLQYASEATTNRKITMKKSKKETKKNIKVRDLRPSKDTKGGVDPTPIVITKPIDKSSVRLH